MFRQDGYLFLTLATVLTVSQMFGGLSHTRLSHRWPQAVCVSTLGQVVTLGVVGYLLGVTNQSMHSANLNTSALIAAVALSLWSVVVAGGAVGGRAPTSLTRRALGILGVISFGCLVCLLLSLEPWSALASVAGTRSGTAGPPEPGDLYRLALYAGSTGLAVPFATAVAALFENASDHSWARHAFGWSFAVWIWLSLAMALAIGLAAYPRGSVCAEPWEPVKSAAVVEWLASAALLYLLGLTIRRGSCGGRALLLATIIFPATCLGFLLMPLRISPGAVSADALDPPGELMALALVRVLLSGALVLYAWKRVVRHLV